MDWYDLGWTMLVYVAPITVAVLMLWALFPEVVEYTQLCYDSTPGTLEQCE